jgi:hypothetical protein
MLVVEFSLEDGTSTGFALSFTFDTGFLVLTRFLVEQLSVSGMSSTIAERLGNMRVEDWLDVGSAWGLALLSWTMTLTVAGALTKGVDDDNSAVGHPGCMDDSNN